MSKNGINSMLDSAYKMAVATAGLVMMSSPQKTTSKKYSASYYDTIYSYKEDWQHPTLKGNLRYHIDWGCENPERIHRAVVDTLNRLRFALELVDIKQSATLFRVEIRLMGRTRFNQLKNAEKEIAIGCGVSNVSVVDEDGKIYIEIPKSKKDTVHFGDLAMSDEFTNANNTSLCIGMDNNLKPIIYDLEKAKHILISGQTGSGKSILIQNLILSLLIKNTPDTMRLFLIDPKMVEFNFYNDIPHIGVINDENEAVDILERLGIIMDARYRTMADAGYRDIDSYNKAFPDNPIKRDVVVIDELSDLIGKCGKRAEDAIVRLAQKARACGMHLIIATQYPVAKVVTGLIKQNMPTKICLSVSSGVASRVAIDENGGEKLLGKGDMLFKIDSELKPKRLQGGYVETDEINRIVTLIKTNIVGKRIIKK